MTSRHLRPSAAAFTSHNEPSARHLSFDRRSTAAVVGLYVTSLAKRVAHDFHSPEDGRQAIKTLAIYF
jgi:hypothetical protein